MINRFKSILVFTLLALCSCKDKKEVAVQPNIILFLVDDLGWKDVKSYGSTLYQTPNVDALAQEGVVFSNAYAAAAVCSPTRASILTGKYPATIHCTDWIRGHHKPFAKYQVPDWTMHLRDQDTTIVDVLKEKGYKTIHIGKWHLGEEEKYWPEAHGFDQNIGGWKVGMPKKIKGKGGYFVPYNNPRLEDGPQGEYLTERLAQEAANYIANNEKEPFFLNFWLYNVHLPLKAKQAKIAKYEALVDSTALQSNATYAAMVEHMDDALGVVVAQLKKSGLYENTIIVFASDNGGITGNKGNQSLKPTITSNFPLRSGKGDMYEGGVRVPLIVNWPNKIAPNKTDVLSISPDIFPTLLGLINQHPSGKKINVDGEDLSDLLLKGKAPKRDAIFWHYPHYHTEGAKPYSAVRKGDWKLISVYEQDKLELYHLADDLSESVNLIDKYPEKGATLFQLLENWKKEVAAQDPIVNPNYDPEKEQQFAWRKTKK
jgi:arylsulfatase A-like enzyme